MDAGVRVEVIWTDDDLVEVRVHAGNGRFAGVAECYVGHDAIPRLAQAARGFPTSNEDRRELELGTLDPRFAGGGARLVLRCVDRVGHAMVDLTLRAVPGDGGRLAETVSLSVAVTPGAIDEFVAALDSMRAVVGAEATLRPAT